MGKILMIGIIAGLIYFLFIRKSGVNIISTKSKKKRKEQLDEETMIECKSCNIYVSTKDSIIKDNLHYCSKECAGVQ